MSAGTGQVREFMKRWSRPLRTVLGIAILLFAALKFRDAWRDAESQAVVWQFDWRWIGASLLMTWAMYGILIAGWRLILTGWGERLGWRDAGRIWTLSSLAALLPGRIWAITGMAVMAERAGVSAAAATGSAIVMQLLSMATGATIGIALLGRAIIDGTPGAVGISGGSLGATLLAAGTLAASLALTSERFVGCVSTMLKRPTPLRPLALNALLLGLGLNAIAWAGYGTAFLWLGKGTIPTFGLTWGLATGVFALAYLVGYLAIFFPGGIGVREAAIVLLLTPIGAVPAGALAVASRIATLINQFGAVVPFLLLRSTPRDHS